MENQDTGRRKFMRKLVGLTAIGAVSSMLLGQQLPKASAASVLNGVGVYDGAAYSSSTALTFGGTVLEVASSLPRVAVNDTTGTGNAVVRFLSNGAAKWDIVQNYLSPAQNIAFLDNASNKRPFAMYSGTGVVAVDADNQNNGTLNNGVDVKGSGLTFGLSSGEGIASKRTAGGNQYGLDFYTGFAPRMSITSAANGGNVGIGTTSPLAPLHVHAATDENYLARDVNVALGLAPGTFLGVGFQGANDAFTANVALGFIGSPVLIAGGNVYMGQTAPSSLPTHQLQMQMGAYCTGTTWVNACDRNLKENFTPLDDQEILSRLESVPIQKWNYKDEPKATHIGPVAQDFYAAYQLGDDDKSIGTVDADGIAFAAIKALHKTMKEQQKRIAILERTVQQLVAS